MANINANNEPQQDLNQYKFIFI